MSPQPRPRRPAASGPELETAEPDDLALAEYRQIKSEQAARIGFRDSLVYVTLVAIAGTLTITHSAHSRGYLLLVPPSRSCSAGPTWPTIT